MSAVMCILVSNLVSDLVSKLVSTLLSIELSISISTLMSAGMSALVSTQMSTPVCVCHDVCSSVQCTVCPDAQSCESLRDLTALLIAKPPVMLTQLLACPCKPQVVKVATQPTVMPDAQISRSRL